MQENFELVDMHQDLAWNMVTHGRPFASPRPEYMLTETSWKKSGLIWVWCTIFSRPEFQTVEYFEIAVESQFAVYNNLLAHYSGWLVPIGQREDIRLLGEFGGQLGISILMEGAEPIIEPSDLEEFFNRGVRALSLTWNNANKYASGNNAKGGLTDAGRLLMNEAAKFGVVIDLSHLNEESFWDVIEYRTKSLPHLRVIASHSNAKSVCPSARNLSDDQLSGIREAGGVVGVVLFNGFLDPDWEYTGYGEKKVLSPAEVFEPISTPESIAQRLVESSKHGPILEAKCPEAKIAKEVSLNTVLDHIEHLSYMLGEDRIGIGSDFDGGFTRHSTPSAFRDLADMEELSELISEKKGVESARGVMCRNWLAFWSEALPD